MLSPTAKNQLSPSGKSKKKIHDIHAPNFLLAADANVWNHQNKSNDKKQSPYHLPHNVHDPRQDSYHHCRHDHDSGWYYSRGSTIQHYMACRWKRANHIVHRIGLWFQFVQETHPIFIFWLVSVVFAACIVWTWSLTSNTVIGENLKEMLLQPNHMTANEYAAMQLTYNFKATDISWDHWCLFGNNDTACLCEDPTEGTDKLQVHAWKDTHNRNRDKITQWNATYGGEQEQLDVVFVGDGLVQSWDGLWYNHKCPDGIEIAEYWNFTFGMDSSLFLGMSLGIYGDKMTNILWRLQHGEMLPPLAKAPDVPAAKVFWLILGSNDLDWTLCSEEVVVLGILRIAEEIHYHHPNSMIVLQALLPRTHHPDGSLEPSLQDHHLQALQRQQPRSRGSAGGGGGGDEKDWENLLQQELHEQAASMRTQNRNFYLWPSIEAINRELEAYCNHHPNFFFFDAARLFLGTVGNENFHSEEHPIIMTNYMPDLMHLNLEGHQLLIDSIQDELEELIFTQEEFFLGP